jgi:hypothetical protein
VKRAFDDFDGRKWNRYISALNNELSVEKCGIELTDEEKKAYNKSLAWLKKERADYPNIPIEYSPVELETD